MLHTCVMVQLGGAAANGITRYTIGICHQRGNKIKLSKRGLLDIPTGQQTYKRNTKAHIHFSNHYA